MKKLLIAISLCLVFPCATMAQEATSPKGSTTTSELRSKESRDEVIGIEVVVATDWLPNSDYVDRSIFLRPDDDKNSWASWEFYNLVSWLKSEKFFEMKDTSQKQDTAPHSPFMTIAVVSTEKRVSKIYSFGYIGKDSTEIRQKFWELEMMIREVSANMELLREQKKRGLKAPVQREENGKETTETK